MHTTYWSQVHNPALTILESVFTKKPGVGSVIVNQKSDEGFLSRGASRRGISLHPATEGSDLVGRDPSGRLASVSVPLALSLREGRSYLR
jgi:hypothetical protein